MTSQTFVPTVAVPTFQPEANRAATIDVVVPVHNEQADLERSVRRLHRELGDHLPYRWRIIIADNASTDATPQIAARLATELPGVRSVRIDRKGRGLALRTVWTASDADVLCYMDVDLSTGLDALPALLAPLVSGHSQVAIGTRLARGSRVERGAKREFISRTYNLLLRAGLGLRVSDAQCGFKAIRADAARELVPRVADNAWFFDTELLVAAQRAGMRVHEVPVTWVDDPDSTVDVVDTAVKDLRGMGRLMAASPVHRFLAIGVVSTLAYLALFALLHGPLGAVWANIVALAVTAVANTHANRRLTFGVRGGEGLVGHHSRGAFVFVLTVLLTTGALGVLHALIARPAVALEATVLVAASVCATVTRYVALKTWVFARRGRTTTTPAPVLARR